VAEKEVVVGFKREEVGGLKFRIFFEIVGLGGAIR
jgi:hypothetical protein